MSWALFALLLGGGFAVSCAAQRRCVARSAARAAASIATTPSKTSPLSAKLPYLPFEHGFLPKMTREEALLILGFNPSDNPTDDQIERQFRYVILHHHTDNGGSSFVSQKIIAARKMLAP